MKYPLENWRRLKRGYRFGEKTFYSDFHLGTDYIVPVGTLVFAPYSCEIIKSGNFSEGGNTIHVRFKRRGYGLIIMRCMHLSKMSPPGKYRAGDILGLTGNTGKLIRGAHLHIDLSRKKVQIKNRQNFIDPEEFFSQTKKL
ncbi:MAG: M23 family metallopeptidase [Patescibacteria group bacterium]|nr:M23 family metallopeptidase [Patescibacteria group bacterium]